MSSSISPPLPSNNGAQRAPSTAATQSSRPLFTQRISHAVTHAINTRRARRQLSIFTLGAASLLFSTLVTRRAIHRRFKASLIPFYYPSHVPPTQMHFSGPAEATEAFAMATLNTTSVMAMLIGGLIWAFDIGSVDDLRQRMRGGMGVDGTGRSEASVEEDLEEWIARVLERQRAREQDDGKDGPKAKANRADKAGRSDRGRES